MACFSAWRWSVKTPDQELNETPRIKRLAELFQQRPFLYRALMPVARAAANQMADAGMRMGAGPLQEALFRIDALEDEIVTIITSEGISEEAAAVLSRLLKDL